MKMILKIWLISLLAGGMMFSSCDSYFDVETDDVVDAENNYKDKSTVYAGLLGLCADFREVADHHIILAELLGDLMEPTTNAPDECWDIYRYSAKSGNSFASPVPYYNLIVNCNDFLKNLVNYKKNYPEALAANIYRGMISAALTYRAWAYLQLGKVYGEAVYYDISFVDNNGETPARLMQLDELVEELIYNLKTGVDGVNGFQTLSWKSIVAPTTSTYDEVWDHICVNADVLLTELYLWNKDYTNAVKTALNFVNASGEAYKLTVFNGSNYHDWDDMFYLENIENDHLKEACTLIPYEFERNQTSKLQYYFSDKAPNVYYFRPLTSAISKFIFQRPVTRPDGTPGYEYMSEKYRDMTYGFENGNFVVYKYSMHRKNYEQDMPVFIYRAAEIYLMIAEGLGALGGENNLAAADSVFNVGFKNSWKADHFEKPFEAPIFSSALSTCPGVRGRAKMPADYIHYYVDTLQYPGVTETEKAEKERRQQFVLDSLLAEETAREFAYEGKRWFALVRMARNLGRPELLAKVVANSKFNTGEAQVYERWLMDPKNWFIKWDHTQITDAIKKEDNK